MACYFVIFDFECQNFYSNNINTTYPENVDISWSNIKTQRYLIKLISEVLSKKIFYKISIYEFINVRQVW